MRKQKKYWDGFLAAVTAAIYLFAAGIQVAFGAGWNRSDYYNATSLPMSPISDIVKNITLWLLSIFGFIAVVGFVISGIIYLTSAGDEDRQETAKRAMIYSITGVIVGLAGLVVVFAADMMLRATGGF